MAFEEASEVKKVENGLEDGKKVSFRLQKNISEWLLFFCSLTKHTEEEKGEKGD